jgi:hypothetical protein
MLSSPSWSSQGGGRSTARALPQPAQQRSPALVPPPAAATNAAASTSGGSAGGQAPLLPYKVGLLDLTVPSRRSPGYTNLLLANDMCIERAVQGRSVA